MTRTVFIYPGLFTSDLLWSRKTGTCFVNLWRFLSGLVRQ